MKLYKISQDENMDYDTYDSAIVCAENKDEAKKTCPDEGYTFKDGKFSQLVNFSDGELLTVCHTWATKLESIRVEYIGKAKEGLKKGIIIASFNAG